MERHRPEREDRFAAPGHRLNVVLHPPCRSERSDLVVCIDVNLTRTSYRVVNVADIRGVALAILATNLFADIDVTVASDEIETGRTTDGRVVATGALRERLITKSVVGATAGVVMECASLTVTSRERESARRRRFSTRGIFWRRSHPSISRWKSNRPMPNQTFGLPTAPPQALVLNWSSLFLNRMSDV